MAAWMKEFNRGPSKVRGEKRINTKDELDAMVNALDDMLVCLQERLVYSEAVNEKVLEVIRARLVVPVCKLAAFVVPDLRKADEYIVAADEGCTVNEAGQGHDIMGPDMRRIEVKVSKCTKKNKYKANFNWPIPTGDTDTERRDKLLRSVEKKTGNGGHFHAKVTNGNGAVLHEYRLGNAFLLKFFTYMPLGSATYNMGSTRCRTCTHFHRIKKFAEMSRQMDEGVVHSHLTWKALFASNVASQC